MHSQIWNLVHPFRWSFAWWKRNERFFLFRFRLVINLHAITGQQQKSAAGKKCDNMFVNSHASRKCCVCVCAKERVLLILVFFSFSFCSEAVKPGKRSALFALFFYYHRMPFLLQITLLCCIHLLNFIASGSNNSGREKIAVSLPQKTEIINVKLFKIHWNVSAIRWWRIRFFLLVYQQ